MFDGLEDALNSFVCHPQVRTIGLGYNMLGDEKWECRITYLAGADGYWITEVLRRENDPLDAYIEARDALREALAREGKG